MLEELNRGLSKKYQIKVFQPPKLGSQKGIIGMFKYLGYLYYILPTSYRAISKKINAGGFKAAIVHHDSYFKSPPALFFLKVRSIYILHEPPREFYEPSCFHAPRRIDRLFNIFRVPIKYIDRYAVRRADVVVTNSYFSKTRAEKIYGIKTRMIYPAISNLFLSRSRVKKETICVSVGSLLPYKGHLLTIKALSRIGEIPRLVIVGNGRQKEKNRLLSEARKLNVNIEIFDSVSDKKLKQIYSNAMVYVNSAYQEPFGLSALEAVACGSKLVTVNNCGTAELKKFFPDRVVVTKRTVRGISNGIAKTLSNRIKENTAFPEIFKGKNTVNEIVKLIEN